MKVDKIFLFPFGRSLLNECLHSKLKNKYKGKKDKSIFETIGLFQELPKNPVCACAFLEHDGSVNCREAQGKESEMSGRKYASKKQRKSSEFGRKKKIKRKQTQAKQSGMSERKNASEVSKSGAPKSSKLGFKKKKVDERENHSIIEKIHYINEEEPVIEIDLESSEEMRDIADKPKPKKEKKSAPDANFIPVISEEMKDVTQAKESEKSSVKCVPEEQPMTSKCDEEKKNVEERENDIEHSVIEKTQNNNQREPVIDIHSENSVTSIDVTDNLETEKASKSVSVAQCDIENLPKGWDRRIIIRKTGKSAGQIDIYFYSPDGIKLRSRRDVAAYLARTKSNLNIEDFDFSKKSISGNCKVKLISS